LNNLRMAPRKVRAVVNLVKGKSITEALGQLEVMAKRSSSPVTKLLKSALSNAENTYDMVRDNLYIKSFLVNEGVKLRRFKPKGFGRVSPIEKKTSHLELVLAERTPGLKRTVSGRKNKEEKQGHLDTVEKQEMKKPEVKTELGRKSNVLSGLGKKIFRRKAI